MNNRRYHLRLGANVSCTNIIMVSTKGISHRDIKGATKDCFIFDRWLSSNKPPEAAMVVGADFIGMVKTNKTIIQGYHLEDYKGLARRFLPLVEEQAYGTRG